jgi:hypothetical protein
MAARSKNPPIKTWATTPKTVWKIPAGRESEYFRSSANGIMHIRKKPPIPFHLR